MGGGREHGFALGEHGFYDKRDAYEESIRVPMIVRWDHGGLPRDAVRSDLVALPDLYATLLHLVGAPPPTSGQAIDSISFRHLLVADASSPATERRTLCTLASAGGVRLRRRSDAAVDGADPGARRLVARLPRLALREEQLAL